MSDCQLPPNMGLLGKVMKQSCTNAQEKLQLLPCSQAIKSFSLSTTHVKTCIFAKKKIIPLLLDSNQL